MDQPWAWGGQYIKAGSTWKSRAARLIVENKTKPEREKERGGAPICFSLPPADRAQPDQAPSLKGPNTPQ